MSERTRERRTLAARQRRSRDEGLPFSNQAKRKHFTMNATTAAKKKISRKGRKKRGNGMRSYLSGWPTLTTQKGGKNAGRAPRYRSD